MAKVTQKDVPVDIAAVGNVEAYTTISVRSQVTGQIEQAFFHEGDVVKKGELLFKIDPRPLEAALQQSQANETRDRALAGSGRSAARARRRDRGIPAAHIRTAGDARRQAASSPGTPASSRAPRPTPRWRR